MSGISVAKEGMVAFNIQRRFRHQESDYDFAMHLPQIFSEPLSSLQYCQSLISATYEMTNASLLVVAL